MQLSHSTTPYISILQLLKHFITSSSCQKCLKKAEIDIRRQNARMPHAERFNRIIFYSCQCWHLQFFINIHAHVQKDNLSREKKANLTNVTVNGDFMTCTHLNINWRVAKREKRDCVFKLLAVANYWRLDTCQRGCHINRVIIMINADEHEK